MTIQDLQTAIAELSIPDLKKFSKWFEEFRAEAWDRELEADLKAGKLDALGEQADRDFGEGRCKPL